MDQPHTAFVELLGLRLNLLGHNGHQGVHFRRGPVPVFRGKGEEGNYRYAAAGQNLHHALYVDHALPVAIGTWQLPLQSPAPVTIHDDGNVLGNWAGVVAGAGVMRGRITVGQGNVQAIKPA